MPKESRIPPRIWLTPTTMDIIVGLHCFSSDYNEMLLWLKTENLNFGGYAPLTLINMGKSEKVQEFINTALDEGKEI